MTSFFLSLLLVVFVLGLLSRSWLHRWRTRQSAKQARPSAGEQLDQLAAQLNGQFTALRSKVALDPNQPLAWAEGVRQKIGIPALRNSAKQAAELSQRFRQWTATALQEEETTSTWLAALSIEAHTAFTQQIAEFCEEMGFDLATLVDGQLNSFPNAAQQATQIVRYYCRANYEAAIAQDNFEATRRFLAYLQAPLAKENQAFGARLYARLQEKQVATEAPETATGTATPPQMLETICATAVRNPTVFSTILSEVVHGSEPIGAPRTMPAAQTNSVQRAANTATVNQDKKPAPTEAAIH
ncbi:MAG: hypothetical protein R3E79_05030 [Caldilineaceae bacterium]